MTVEEQTVLKALASCRTAALGGHVAQCDHCGHRQISYNSCRNRHCPKCQAAARAAWLEERQAELLPVHYFHVVFTIPAFLAQIAWQNKRVVYEILLRTSADTLREIAADPKHLGARIGFLSVLHTWGQNLLHHPHVQCVVPGGGLSHDEVRWISCRKNFFLPVKVLSRVFRGKFLKRLKTAQREGKLSFHGSLAALKHPAAWDQTLAQAYQTEWVVYAKPPFGGPQQVLKYLARYTHRVAISNDRLLALENGQVTFRWKNYAAQSRWSTLTLGAAEFIRRFLLHVLPSGFVRIRHYGLLANPHRQAQLAHCRALLGEAPESSPLPLATPAQEPADLCPVCRQGRLALYPQSSRPTVHAIYLSWPFNTS